MSENPIDLSNEKECHEYMINELKRFDILFEDIKNIDFSAMGPETKMFLDELFSFNSIKNKILEEYSEEASNTEEFKQMVYPVIRRLLEKYFNILYIFDQPEKMADRYKSYLKSIETQYNKMLKDLTENNYRTDGLPSEMHKYDGEIDFPGDLKSMLLTMINENTKSNG